MHAGLVFEPLGPDHVDAMAALLCHAEVYRHIGGPPPLQQFRLGMRRAIAGPPPGREDERWINHAVRLAATGELLGRVEATVHGSIAEVAFLFGPAHWGRGHATSALRWLHDHLRALPDAPTTFWGTTLPANTRSAALLERCGYLRVDPVSAPRLLSYDDGDLVYRRAAAEQTAD